MRTSVISCVLGSLVVVSCSSSNTPMQLVGKTRSPIIGGTVDTTHTAVVAILSTDGSNQNEFDECSGSIVQVKGGNGYVLTAAHCCGGDPSNPNVSPSIVVLATDYGPYEQDIGNSNPAHPAYPIIPASVKWDPGYTSSGQQAYDFCMLQFSGATSSTPTLQLPTSSNDGLAEGVVVDFVGYGVTSSSQNNSNSERYQVTGTIDMGVTATLIQYSEGSQTNPGGPCSGDSGGPALLPANAAQSSQVVVATTSYGDANCAQYGASMRVSSEIGSNGFITEYLAGNPDPGSAGGDAGAGGACTSCQDNVTSTGGACYAEVTACENDTDCSNLATCLNGCAANDQTCVNNCATTDSAGVSDYNAVINCICNTGCPSQCASVCATPATDAGVAQMSDGGGGGGGGGSGSGKDSGSGSGGGSGGGLTGDDSGTGGGGSGNNEAPFGNNGGKSGGCAAAPGPSVPASGTGALGAIVGLALLVSRRRRRG